MRGVVLVAGVCLVLGWGALGQPALYPEGPQALPLEGGLEIALPNVGLEVDNNTLTLADLINVGALLRDPQPTDILLLAAKVPRGTDSVATLRGLGQVFAVAWPFGVDPLTGSAAFTLGLSYGIEARGRLNIGKDLVSLAQDGAQPGDVLVLDGTKGTGAVFDRLTLQAALPLLDGLVVAGAELSVLYARFLAHAGLGGSLYYDANGYDGGVSLEAVEGGGGFGYQLGFGVQTRLPTLGAGIRFRVLGQLSYTGDRRTVSVQATDAAALDIVECLRNGTGNTQVSCVSQTTQMAGSLPLPTEIDAYAYYPIFLGQGEPLFLLARARGVFGGFLDEGWRLGVGASYRLFTQVPVGVELGIGGPSGFSVGFRVGLELPGAELRFGLAQRGGFLLGAKGAEFRLAAVLK